MEGPLGSRTLTCFFSEETEAPRGASELSHKECSGQPRPRLAVFPTLSPATLRAYVISYQEPQLPLRPGAPRLQMKDLGACGRIGRVVQEERPSLRNPSGTWEGQVGSRANS